jgi:hypothetical protein
MLKRTIAIVTACALLGLFAGCTSSGNIYREETALEQNWGRSVETAKFNQILDPEAGKSSKPVEGLSGDAAGHAVDKYENSFKEKSVQQGAATTSIGASAK